MWLVLELAGHISSHIPMKNHTFSLKWLLCVSLNSHPLSGWRSLSRHQILLVFSLISGDPLVTRPEPIQPGCIAQVLLLHGGTGFGLLHIISLSLLSSFLCFAGVGLYQVLWRLVGNCKICNATLLDAYCKNVLHSIHCVCLICQFE